MARGKDAVAKLSKFYNLNNKQLKEIRKMVKMHQRMLNKDKVMSANWLWSMIFREKEG